MYQFHLCISSNSRYRSSSINASAIYNPLHTHIVLFKNKTNNPQMTSGPLPSLQTKRRWYTHQKASHSFLPNVRTQTNNNIEVLDYVSGVPWDALLLLAWTTFVLWTRVHVTILEQCARFLCNKRRYARFRKWTTWESRSCCCCYFSGLFGWNMRQK